MTALPVPRPEDVYDAETVAGFRAAGYWRDETLSASVDRLAGQDQVLLTDGYGALTGAQLREQAYRLAAARALADQPSSPKALREHDEGLHHVVVLVLDDVAVVHVGLGRLHAHGQLGPGPDDRVVAGVGLGRVLEAALVRVELTVLDDQRDLVLPAGNRGKYRRSGLNAPDVGDIGGWRGR